MHWPIILLLISVEYKYMDMFPVSTEGQMEEDKWAHFYEKLATPQDLLEFNGMHKRLSATSAAAPHTPLLSWTTPGDWGWPSPDTCTASNKATYIFGVSSEHLKHASPIIIPILTNIINRVFASGKLPDDVKIGLATPGPKKTKTQTDPDKFRRLTITSMICK